MLGLGFIVKAVKPYLNKIGEAMFENDKNLNSKDMCILITKRKAQDGKVHTFMSYVERPENLNDLYIRDNEGKPITMGIDGIITLIGDGGNDEG